MIFKVIAPQPYGVVLPIVLGYERINDMDEVNRIDPSLYYLATQKHKKEFEQQAERIKELEEVYDHPNHEDSKERYLYEIRCAIKLLRGGGEYAFGVAMQLDQFYKRARKALKG